MIVSISSKLRVTSLKNDIEWQITHISLTLIKSTTNLWFPTQLNWWFVLPLLRRERCDIEIFREDGCSRFEFCIHWSVPSKQLKFQEEIKFETSRSTEHQLDTALIDSLRGKNVMLCWESLEQSDADYPSLLLRVINTVLWNPNTSAHLHTCTPAPLCTWIQPHTWLHCRVRLDNTHTHRHCCLLGKANFTAQLYTSARFSLNSLASRKSSENRALTNSLLVLM